MIRLTPLQILVPNAYLRRSGLCDLDIAEATVASLQGSNSTCVSALWLVLFVAGIVGWVVTQGL